MRLRNYDPSAETVWTTDKGRIQESSQIDAASICKSPITIACDWDLFEMEDEMEDEMEEDLFTNDFLWGKNE